MITALTFRQFAGVVTWTCVLIRCGLRSYAWGKSLDEAHGKALDLLKVMEAGNAVH